MDENSEKKQRVRVAVLASGGGSNLAALLAATTSGGVPAEIRLVLSDRPGAYALERARAAGVATAVLEPRTFPDRDAFADALLATLQRHAIEVVCLAGYMRLVSPRVVRAFEGRMLNIHPSLLPAFPGLHGVRQALEHGVKVTGCTVHLVTEALDEGPIVAQAAVEVREDDTEETLLGRIHAEEHRIYPIALRAVVEGRCRVVGRCVRVEGELE